jgi:hypothetical protein
MPGLASPSLSAGVCVGSANQRPCDGTAAAWARREGVPLRDGPFGPVAVVASVDSRDTVRLAGSSGHDNNSNSGPAPPLGAAR